jgi:dTDP-glucose 4,6-dehydratase
MDITKIKNELGWRPRYSLGGGLQKTVEWYLNHPEWVADIHQQVDYQKWLGQNYDNRIEQAQRKGVD